MRRRADARCECFPLYRTCRGVDRLMRTILFVTRRPPGSPRRPPRSTTLPAKASTACYKMILQIILAHAILHRLLMAIAVVPSLRRREVFAAAHL